MRATSAWGQGDGHSCLNIADGNPSGGSLGLVSTVLKAMCFYWETGLTYFSCHSRQVGVATWSFLVLPIDKVHHTLAYISIEIYRWAIIEELSKRRRLRIFLISWGQKTRVKHCYVELSSWYEFWFAIICIGINIISDLSTTIRRF